MERYQNKYRSESFRLKNWDYGSPGYYYVTICTKNREHYFGDVVMCDRAEIHANLLPPGPHPAPVPVEQSTDTPSAVVHLTEIGQIAQQNWIEIPTHFPFVSLDEFVIMPNHVHGILCFHKPGYRERKANTFGPQSQNLGSVIRNYKGATKAFATSHGIDFAWQARYHDDVITSRKELDKIREYIRNNPLRWIEKMGMLKNSTL